MNPARGEALLEKHGAATDATTERARAEGLGNAEAGRRSVYANPWARKAAEKTEDLPR